MSSHALSLRYAAIEFLPLLALLTGPALAQESLKRDLSWEKLVATGRSLVLGRFEGQFDGPQFHSRKIWLLQAGSSKEYYLPVGDGLGYFHSLLPPGVYVLKGVEANYAPLTRPLDVRRYRPIKQKFAVRAADGGAQSPSFRVPVDRPVYIGTIQADTASDGIVYRGHQLRVLDEYQDAVEHLEWLYPTLAASLSKSGLAPNRHFLLKPTSPEPGLEIIGVEDPIRKAREYIGEGKFEQAINWLTTFLPTSEEERVQSRLVMGEALLADGRYDEAIEKLGEVLQAHPENLRALRLLARAHAQKGNLEDAVSLFEALARAAPGDAEAHLQLGYLFALRADPSRSAREFSNAFETDFDYLLHDAAPFAVALMAVKSKAAEYEPPRMVRQDRPPPPVSLRSRRGAEGGLDLVIDHRGKVVAARLAAESSGPEPLMLMSIIGAIFKPAALNGIPVPSLLSLGGRGQPSQ